MRSYGGADIVLIITTSKFCARTRVGALQLARKICLFFHPVSILGVLSGFLWVNRAKQLSRCKDQRFQSL